MSEKHIETQNKLVSELDMLTKKLRAANTILDGIAAKRVGDGSGYEIEMLRTSANLYKIKMKIILDTITRNGLQ